MKFISHPRGGGEKSHNVLEDLQAFTVFYRQEADV